ncbi:hypothetical protein MJ904_02625 [Massilia sp. MB5]|uniref:PP0621 family protein n=1 Tax=unclassified Massilia TaxID=2609279 RepID=UPI00067BB4AB|nr:MULTISPECIES: PP0621 family protein [unclassified Massilia]AKU23882.1 hypothetical protein ACZ75_22935 [Massilia sp. NR 4-1]UMR31165.1 hypothetical protein MJ904_02625 [Massilia sp. MB5]
MTRILFWLALIFLVIAAIRSKLKSASRPPEQQPGRPRAAAEAPPQAEAMLCCAHCGVHYPASENVVSDGRNYCSPAHAGLPAP